MADFRQRGISRATQMIMRAATRNSSVPVPTIALQPVPALRSRTCTWKIWSSQLHFRLAVPAPVAELFALDGITL